MMSEKVSVGGFFVFPAPISAPAGEIDACYDDWLLGDGNTGPALGEYHKKELLKKMSEIDNEDAEWVCECCFNHGNENYGWEWYPSFAITRQCDECYQERDCIPCELPEESLTGDG